MHPNRSMACLVILIFINLFLPAIPMLMMAGCVAAALIAESKGRKATYWMIGSFLFPPTVLSAALLRQERQEEPPVAGRESDAWRRSYFYEPRSAAYDAEPPFRFQRRHAAHAGGRHRLPIGLVGHVARGEYSGTSVAVE